MVKGDDVTNVTSTIVPLGSFGRFKWILPFSGDYPGVSPRDGSLSFWVLQVIDIAEVRYIRELDLLRNLNLLGNPIQGMPDYRLSLLFRIQSLTELDRSKVSVEEKVMNTL